jgi:hypothetical protein
MEESPHYKKVDQSDDRVFDWGEFCRQGDMIDKDYVKNLVEGLEKSMEETRRRHSIQGWFESCFKKNTFEGNNKTK